jgi:hypothetical protein
LIPKWGALGLAVSYGLAYTATCLGLWLYLFLYQSSWLSART